MARHKLNWMRILSLALAAGAGGLPLSLVETAWAQPPGGGSEDFALRILRRLDRDENGTLDPDELAQSSRFRDYLAQQGVDVERPVSLGVAADYQAGMFQEMQAQRGGGEGFGGRGGFGPPGSMSPSSDGGGRSRGDRGDRGSSDRGSRGGGPGGGDMGSSRGSRGGRGESSSGTSTPGKPGTPSKVRVGRVGPKLAQASVTLPSQYSGRDINRDGQIGLYEWSRTDLSTFRRLDTNGDGFLTAAELASPGSGTTLSSTSSGGATTFTSSAAVSTNTPGASVAAKPATPSGPPADPKVAGAEMAFDYLDKEDASGKKDGVLSAEEFARSRNASKMFADAKIEIQYPLTKQKFVENYVKLSK
ncbi:MAG: hypothetical protein V4719_22300 [Planctomycetota bacterium]